MTLKVLVVEDDGLVRAMATEALLEAGFAVLEATTGEEAVNCCRQRIVDVLFTDVRLPGALDGWDIAERCREAIPQLLVIYATGYSARHPRRVPRSTMFHKPYTPEQLVSAVVAAEEARGRETLSRRADVQDLVAGGIAGCDRSSQPARDGGSPHEQRFRTLSLRRSAVVPVCRARNLYSAVAAGIGAGSSTKTILASTSVVKAPWRSAPPIKTDQAVRRLSAEDMRGRACHRDVVVQWTIDDGVTRAHLP